MQLYNSIQRYVSQHCRGRFVGKFVGKVGIVAVIGLLSLGLTLFASVSHVQAASVCKSGEISYTVVSGDTLSQLGARYGTTWAVLASRNEIANPDLIFVAQRLCIPGKQSQPIAVPAQQQPAPAAKVVEPAPQPPVQPAPVQVAAPAQPVAPVQPVAPAQPASSSVEGIIDQVFGSYAGQARAVASCESGFNPNATNSYSGASGVFQFLPSTWATTSQAGQSPYNAYANVRAAYEVFARDGYSWREWSCKP